MAERDRDEPTASILMIIGGKPVSTRSTFPVIKYSDIEDAIRRANASPNGLGGSIWSNDLKKAAALAMRLECGTAWVNEHGAIQPNAPFGGIKQSGIGVEFGPYGLAEYTSIQTLKVMKSRPGSIVHGA